MEIRDFVYKKSLGQNFIFDENFLLGIIKEIAITENDTVVEIGAGAGTLTRALSKTAKSVISYEIDNRLNLILQNNLRGCNNVELHFADALKVETFPDNFKLVANIPYYITTPLLLKFIRMPACTEICVLVQEELAERIIATCRTKEYGALSITMQTAGDCSIIKRVPRRMFTPSPNVDSAFVLIRKKPSAGVLDFQIFDNLVKGVFSARRKTMSNALKQTLGIEAPLAQKLLQEAAINETFRPEQIPPDKFVKLSQIITETSIL